MRLPRSGILAPRSRHLQEPSTSQCPGLHNPSGTKMSHSRCPAIHRTDETNLHLKPIRLTPIFPRTDMRCSQKCLGDRLRRSSRHRLWPRVHRKRLQRNGTASPHYRRSSELSARKCPDPHIPIGTKTARHWRLPAKHMKQERLRRFPQKHVTATWHLQGPERLRIR